MDTPSRTTPKAIEGKDTHALSDVLRLSSTGLATSPKSSLDAVPPEAGQAKPLPGGPAGDSRGPPEGDLRPTQKARAACGPCTVM